MSEVSETAAWNLMVRPNPKWWSATMDLSDFTVPSLSRLRISVFGHVARLDDGPAPSRPRNKWLDQLRNDSTRPIESSGNVLSTVDMVVQRRNDPRRLSDKTWWWWWWWWWWNTLTLSAATVATFLCSWTSISGSSLWFLRLLCNLFCMLATGLVNGRWQFSLHSTDRQKFVMGD